MAGFLPVLLAAAVGFRPRAWRDNDVGPLLVVFWAAAIGLAVETGFFLAGLSIVPWGVERYMAYTLGPLLVLVVVAFTRRDLVTMGTLGLAALLSATLLLAPALGNATEERAIGATMRRIHDVAGGMSTPLALWLVALVMCSAILLILRRARDWPVERTAIAASAVVFVALVVQSASAWKISIDVQRTWRSQFPADLAWVDHNSDRPVGVLEGSRNALGFEQYEFFNTKIARFYASSIPVPGRAIKGRVCPWKVANFGYVEFTPGCGSTPSRFFVNDPYVHVTFHNESAVVTDPHAGRLMTVSGRPRARSVVYMPCARKTIRFTRPYGDVVPDDKPEQCQISLIAYVWIDDPGRLLLRIRGGDAEHSMVVGRRRYKIEAEKTGVLELPVQANGVMVQANFDWAERAPNQPEVIGVELKQGARTTSLL
jgi:hypothetical protein